LIETDPKIDLFNLQNNLDINLTIINIKRKKISKINSKGKIEGDVFEIYEVK
jgi:hypothetical protein